MRNFAGHNVLLILCNPGGTCRNIYGREQLGFVVKRQSVGTRQGLLNAHAKQCVRIRHVF
jgi:hypothetical protein